MPRALSGFPFQQSGPNRSRSNREGKAGSAEFIAINGHDYLLPVSAEMRLTIGRRQAVLNTIEFRNYRRFGSNMRILGFTPVDEKLKPEKP